MICVTCVLYDRVNIIYTRVQMFAASLEGFPNAETTGEIASFRPAQIKVTPSGSTFASNSRQYIISSHEIETPGAITVGLA